MDDILVTGATQEDCLNNTQLILGALKMMGKDVSPKSVTTPSQEMDCIGIRFSGNGYRISDDGIEKLRAALSKKGSAAEKIPA
jgi:hypothetical protein